MAEIQPAPRLSWPRRLPVWVLPLFVMGVQLAIGHLSQLHLPPGHGPPWAQAHRMQGADAAPGRALDALGYGLLVLGPVSMVFRRARRTPAFLGVLAADCVFFAFGYPSGPAFVSLIVSFFGAVLNRPRLLAWLLCPVAYTLAVWSAPIFGRGPGPGLAEGIVPFAWPVAVLTLAEVVRLARDRIAQNQEARAEVERRRHEETRRRASEERLRIAQELHDVLAHNISMINVQASTALHLLDDQPERARPSLSAIKDASKEALVELRTALDVLRQSGERAPRAPTTGLDRLDALVDRTRSAGLAVDLTIDGTRRTLPPGVDLAAFRIVQEALTNVVRHAQARHATVRVGYATEALTIEVDDDGTGPSGPVDTDGPAGGTSPDGADVTDRTDDVDRADGEDSTDHTDATYGMDRPDRTDRTDRPDGMDGADRTDATYGMDRADRTDATYGMDRADHTDATYGMDRTDRPDRTDRTDRTDRADGMDGADRTDAAYGMDRADDTDGAFRANDTDRAIGAADAADAAGTDGEAGEGNGIVGMRERAATLGGELDAGPRPGGGFRVRAWLPFTDGRGPA